MLTVITFVFLALAICAFGFGIGGAARRNYWWDTSDEAFCALMIIGIIMAIAFTGCGIAVLCYTTKIHTESKYDQQIAIVSEINTDLERQICTSVENYLKHEEAVFETVNIETAIGLFSIYPNLKSNELVEKLVTTYQTNAAEIKELQIKKTELATARWLVKFG